MEAPSRNADVNDLEWRRPHAETSQVASPIKRKRTAESEDGHDKRRKVEFPSCRGLPAELWQHVFLHLPPLQLGRLLKVNRAFNLYLTDSQRWQRCRRNVTPSKLLDPQYIWIHSRISFHPSIPKPLIDCTELDMWRLLKGTKCQFCGRQRTKSKAAGSVWEKGPGENGVRAIWPFAVLCCGSCLREHSQSDTQVLLSSASAFRQVLPFALVTDSLQWIPTAAMKQTSFPQDLNITKLFLSRHIEVLQQKLEEVRTLGIPAAEEWFKGQEARYHEKLNDVLRWERWEYEGGYERMNSVPSSPIGKPATHTRAKSGLHTPVQAWMNKPSGAQTQYTLSRPPSIAGTHGLYHQSRPEKILQEANEAKAVRKAEIERRCSQLDPPIPLKILQHMESFKAAIQIGTELTDSAWDMLKPRILAQKAAAEQLEEEKMASYRAQQAKSEERRQQEAMTRATIEAADKEWEEAQAPIREKLSGYADESIRNTWADGTSITWESSPQFAADVILYVRKRFYSDLAKDDAAAMNPGQEIDKESGNVPSIRILTLENMKWIYETKIKPLTDRFRKELFLCNGCDSLSKVYAFDGVIQHYAAKHTNTFSVGHSSVHWKTAEWPEIPPFVPDLNARKLDMLAMSTTGSNLPVQASNSGQLFPYGPTPMSVTRSQAVQNLAMSPVSFGNMAYPNQLSMAQYGPYGPPLPYYGHPSPFGQPVMQQSFSPPYVDQVRFKPPTGHHYSNPYPGQSLFHGQTALTPTQIPAAWPPPDSGNFVAPRRGAAPLQQDSNRDKTIDSSTGSMSLVSGLPHVNLYDSQKEYVAGVACYIWNETSGIKGMPPSVRIYAIIHQVISQFRIQFSNEPNLDLFSDALLNNPRMVHIKNADGLACKPCVLSNHEGNIDSSLSFQYGERVLYSFHSLLVHFRDSHIEYSSSYKGRNAPRLDWREDMIEMPSEALIIGLANAPGMDSKKLKLFAEVFPTLLSVNRFRDSKAILSTPANYSYADLSSPNSEKKLNDMPNKARISRPVSSTSQGQLSPGNDEYDPRRPAFLDPRKDVALLTSRISHRSDGGPEASGPSPSQQSHASQSRQASKASQNSHPFRVSSKTSLLQSPAHSSDVLQDSFSNHRESPLAHVGIIAEDGELHDQRSVILPGNLKSRRQYTPRTDDQVSPDEQASRFLEDYNLDTAQHTRRQPVKRQYSPAEFRAVYRPAEEGFIALDDDDPYARHPVVYTSRRGSSRVSDRPSYVKVEELPHSSRYYDANVDEPVQLIRIERGSRVPERFSDGGMEYVPIVRSGPRQPLRTGRAEEYMLVSRGVSRQPLHDYEDDLEEDRIPLGETHRRG